VSVRAGAGDADLSGGGSHGLAAPGGQQQDLQIFLCATLRPVFFSQRVVRKSNQLVGNRSSR
jgi:hypothetical protein